MLPNLAEMIPDQAFSTVRDDLEIYRYPVVKNSIQESELADVSKQDLLEAIDIAKGKQNSYREFVDERAERFGKAIQFFSIPIVIEDAPIGVAGSVVLKKAIGGYSRLMSKEVDTRKQLIDNFAFTEVSGNKWIDNRRWAWNFKFYRTKFLVKAVFMCVFYQFLHKQYREAFEFNLCLNGESSKRECVSEMWAKTKGERNFTRMKSAEELYPLSISGRRYSERNEERAAAGEEDRSQVTDE